MKKSFPGLRRYVRIGGHWTDPSVPCTNTISRSHPSITDSIILVPQNFLTSPPEPKIPIQSSPARSHSIRLHNRCFNVFIVVLFLCLFLYDSSQALAYATIPYNATKLILLQCWTRRNVYNLFDLGPASRTTTSYVAVKDVITICYLRVDYGSFLQRPSTDRRLRSSTSFQTLTTAFATSSAKLTKRLSDDVLSVRTCHDSAHAARMFSVSLTLELLQRSFFTWHTVFFIIFCRLLVRVVKDTFWSI